MAEASGLRVLAPAKVNLTLEILGPRPDGYHELRSVVMPVSLFEGVSVSTRADDAVTCETRGEGVDASELEGLPLERQLAVKAVRAMQRRLGRTGPGSGVDVRVSKRVPIGAGMGGVPEKISIPAAPASRHRRFLIGRYFKVTMVMPSPPLSAGAVAKEATWEQVPSHSCMARRRAPVPLPWITSTSPSSAR